MTDFRLALRMLRKQPAMALLAVIALALGIGLTTMMFSIVNGAVLRGLPFEGSDRIYTVSRVNQTATSGSGIEPNTLHDYVDWRTRQSAFEGLAAFAVATMNVVGPDGTPERYQGVWITPNTFRLLRVRPVLGRDFRDDEEKKGAEPVVIISDKVWRERFGGATNAIGQMLRINGASMTVVGVMPPRFAFPAQQHLWTPLTIDLDPAKRAESRQVTVIGRLRDAVSLDAARAEAAAIAAQLAQEYPETNKNFSAIIRTYIETFLGSQTINALMTMLVAVFGVLVIACSNVANLVLARAADRTREVAVRTAVGASRSRVIRQMLTEVLLLAILGASAGLGIAYLGVTLFNRGIVDTNPPFWIDIRIDGMVLSFVVAIAATATIVAGLVPAWRASRTDLASVMKDEGRSTGLRLGRLSRGLVVAELALSFGLLVMSGLAIQSIVNLANADLGFAMADVWGGRVTLPDLDYPEDPQQRQLQEALLSRVQGLPGVVSAALATDVAPNAPTYAIKFPGVDYLTDRDFAAARGSTITPDYLKVLRSGVLRGRVFDSRDHADAPPVAVVNQSFERKYFADGALGKQFALARGANQQWRTIVGVVPDLGFGVTNDGRVPEGFYMSFAQVPPSSFAIVVHASGPPLELTTPIRQTVRTLDPNLPLFSPGTLLDAKDQFSWPFRVFGSLFMAFGVAALFLATVGLYGVMAFSVSKRTQEIGVRMALGAASRDVLGLVLRQGLLQVGLGIGLGLAIAFTLASFMTVLMFGVTHRDPFTYIVIGVVLGLTGLTACLIPARRAASVDPMTALRYQ